MAALSDSLYVDCIGEGLRLAKDKLGEKNVYYMNPSLDKGGMMKLSHQQ